ncbi:hypothetical protein F5Y05DRAFT_79443 [Hypoxylon sp. FL0543]|nr:hypothetical protein F5Y05DRAFT_79443 [Hypoxylon sp. FL0543]
MAEPQDLHSEKGSLPVQRPRVRRPKPILYYGAYTCFLLAVVCPAVFYAYTLYRTFWAFVELVAYIFAAAWKTRAAFTLSILNLLCRGSPSVAAIMLLLDDSFRHAALPALGWYMVLSGILAFYLGLFVLGVYGLEVMKGTDQRHGEHPYLVRKLIPHLPWLWDVFTVTLPPPWGRFTLAEFCGDDEERWYSTSAHPRWTGWGRRGVVQRNDISVSEERRRPVFSPTPKVDSSWTRQRHR